MGGKRRPKHPRYMDAILRTMTYLRFLKSLLLHKWYVLLAGYGSVPLYRLLIHDYSKFTRSEFPAYARRFGVGRGGKLLDIGADPGEWQRAWVHHWHQNPHHWEYWLKLVDGIPVAMEMPPTYVLEMIADWKGASRAYTGSWDLSEWFNQSHGRMILHPRTNAMVLELLRIAD